ncbi:MAG: hypothetical protein J6S49_08940 [Erysipelotrichaceae bacterium]|nr:hypothetical protein [Erysipelotrichaceae bacterium]
MNLKLTVFDEDVVLLDRMLELINKYRTEMIFYVHDSPVKGKYTLSVYLNDTKRRPVALYKGLDIDDTIRLLAKYLSYSEKGDE